MKSLGLSRSGPFRAGEAALCLLAFTESECIAAGSGCDRLTVSKGSAFPGWTSSCLLPALCSGRVLPQLSYAVDDVSTDLDLAVFIKEYGVPVLMFCPYSSYLGLENINRSSFCWSPAVEHLGHSIILK